MFAEIHYQLAHLQLEVERKMAAREGIAMGWTNCDESLRQIAKAVAIAATAAGLGDITVTDLPLVIRSGDAIGIKVKDTANTHLSGFWQLVNDVQDQIGMGANQVDSGKLNQAVQKTIADKQSGELGRKLNARDRERIFLE